MEEGTIEQTLCRMLPERTGLIAREQSLLGVLEEPHVTGYALRFVFLTQVSEASGPPADHEIAAVRWFSREAAAAVLEERDVVPALGVMTLLRNWAEGNMPAPLLTLRDDVTCPCGSGFSYAGCCGWDMR